MTASVRRPKGGGGAGSPPSLKSATGICNYEIFILRSSFSGHRTFKLTRKLLNFSRLYSLVRHAHFIFHSRTFKVTKTVYEYYISAWFYECHRLMCYNFISSDLSRLDEIFEDVTGLEFGMTHCVYISFQVRNRILLYPTLYLQVFNLTRRVLDDAGAFHIPMQSFAVKVGTGGQSYQRHCFAQLFLAR